MHFFSEYLGEMDIPAIKNCGLGVFNVWHLPLFQKEARINIMEDWFEKCW
jgi:hypothetical protein